MRRFATFLVLLLPLVLLAACDLSEETDVAGPGTPPPPVFVSLAESLVGYDCGHGTYLYEVEARVHGASVPVILELTWGDGASASIEGTVLRARHQFEACGLPGREGEGWLARATATLPATGEQYFADKTLAPCSYCTSSSEVRVAGVR